VTRSSVLAALVACAALAACAGGDAPKPAEPPPAPAAAVAPDAMQFEPLPSGVFDPASGRHLDDDAPPVITPRPPERPTRAPLRPIDVTLRSTPPGAMAAVDGVPLGPTPVYWNGDANGRVHEFTFVAPHYAVARYRFVPITSGILYAKLDAVAGEEPSSDAKTPPAPLAVPGLAPPPPVPTVLTPAAAVPRPSPPPPPVDAAAPPPDAGVPPDATAPAPTPGLGPTP